MDHPSLEPWPANLSSPSRGWTASLCARAVAGSTYLRAARGGISVATAPRGYCQVEAFKADPTPRCWQRGALEPHYLAARSKLETST